MKPDMSIAQMLVVAVFVGLFLRFTGFQLPPQFATPMGGVTGLALIAACCVILGYLDSRAKRK